MAAAADLNSSDLKNADLKAFTDNLVKVLEKNPEILVQAQEKYFTQRADHEEKKSIQNIRQVIEKSPDIFNISSCPQLGSSKGKKVVHALVSPYCGYCQSFLKSLLEKMKNNEDVKLNLILGGYEGHEGSKIAARALTAAASKGKLKEFLEMFLKKVNMLEKKDLPEVATAIGLEPKEFNETYESQEVTDYLNGAKKAISKLKVNGFPTIIKEDVSSADGKKDYEIIFGLPSEDKLSEFFSSGSPQDE